MCTGCAGVPRGRAISPRHTLPSLRRAPGDSERGSPSRRVWGEVGHPRNQDLAQGLAWDTPEVSTVPALCVRSGEPVAAAEAISARRNRGEAASVGVRRAGLGMSKVNPIHGDSGGCDLHQVSRESREDLEDRGRAPRTRTRREIRATAAQPGYRWRQTGRNQPATSQGCVFRSKATSDSSRRRPLIPTEGDHQFQSEGDHFSRCVGMGGRDPLERVVVIDRNLVRR